MKHSRLLLVILFTIINFHSSFSQDDRRGMSKVIPANEALKGFNKTWALVIGIDEYISAARLKFAVNDAHAVRDVFIKEYGVNPKNLIELYDTTATRSNIIRAFERLSNESRTEDRVIVFYAGHGITVALPENRERGYILPIDGDPASPISTAISTDMLSELTEAIPAKHLYAIMDACYGGLIFSRATPISAETQDFVETISKRRTRQALTAGGRDQPVYDTGPGGHSVFTFHLLEGLKNKYADLDKNGVITASELASYIMPRVTTESHRQQTPQYGILIGDRGGEFIFVPQPKIASLSITSNVPNADVYVDRRLAGTAPMDVDIHSFGKVNIIVAASGYTNFIKDIDIQNEIESVTATLDKASWLRINSVPDGANVFVNDSLVGKAPLVLNKIAQRPQKIYFAMEDYEDVQTIVDLTNQDTYKIEQQLSKKKGMLTLTGIAGKAAVKISNKEKSYQFASLPLKNARVEYNDYTLSIEKDGYYSFSSTMDIHAPTVSFPLTLGKKSLAVSYLLSTAIPGAGQIFMGRKTLGWSLAASGLISLSAAAYSYKTYDTYRADYDRYTFLYAKATSVTDLNLYYDKLTDTNKKMSSYKTYFLASAGITGAVYLYSIFDALLFSPDPLLQNGRIGIDVSMNALNVKISLN